MKLGNYLLWLYLLVRAFGFESCGSLPVTSGGAEIASPSCATFYGVRGLLVLLCDPAAMRLLLALLLLHSHGAAFLTIRLGFNF